MEVDSPPPSEPVVLSPRDHVLQRLHQLGIPEELLNQLQPGLVTFVKDNKFRLDEIATTILPTDKNLLEAFLEAKTDNGGVGKCPSMKEQFRESILWLQWLMFECEPRVSLKNLAKASVGQRGVCGVIWGKNDIAYRCRTCENDPTCAICVPCFQNGNHKDHDFSIIYTGGGCCDCGDVTAWKHEGFCSKHKGSEQVQPLDEDTANTVGPVLDVLLIYWHDKLGFAQNTLLGNPRTGDSNDGCVKVANELTSTVVEMLLEFSKFSESLLNFVSRRVFSRDGLLDVLVRAERFLCKAVMKKLHELFLKLLGEPSFKYEFAKVFINYYPETVKEAIKECNDDVLDKCPLVSTFSVQIFTVPTLTPQLVKTMNLMDMLLVCLGDIFLSCVGEDGHLQVVKLASLDDTTIRVIEDTRYVLSHAEVPKYVIHEQPEMCRTWIRLLTFIQGMNPQKRETGSHVEEENEHMHTPFVMGHYIANIHSLLTTGAFSGEQMESDSDGSEGIRHAKVGRLSQESSVCSSPFRSSAADGVSQVAEEKYGSGAQLPVPSSVSWLIFECLRAIDNWLGFNVESVDTLNFLSNDACSSNSSNFFALKKTISKIRRGKSIPKVLRTPSARYRLNVTTELHGRLGASLTRNESGICIDLGSERRLLARNNKFLCPSDMDIELPDESKGSDERIVETDPGTESETPGLLSLSEWPDISYDVSSQDISAHIPLHRLLSMLLQKALNRCFGESESLDVNSTDSVSPSLNCFRDFFGWVLGGCHPVGFSAFLMEHPLRIRVFCAEVRAGMWRKNGDTALLSCDWYRSVRWSEQGLELDLFLLQCCAALAPPELYVERILERFGLSSYLSLDPELSNEYEAVLVQEMLTLIIQIVKERRFCGLSTAENLQRELVHKLAIGDATRSHLVKSLPHDLSKNPQLQKILDTVAAYINPSGLKQGKYSLRQAYWEELDLYHPRWNSRDLQTAEERYFRFLKVSALSSQLPRCTKVFYPFSGILRIATCGTVFRIIRAVLFYATSTDKASSSRAPDGVIITALHLLSLGLDICYLQRKSDDKSSVSTSNNTEDPFPILAFAGEESDLGAANRSQKTEHQSLLSLLVSLMRTHKKEAVSSFTEAGQCNLSFLIENLLKKFAELSVSCMTKLQTLAPELVCQLQSISKNNVQTSGLSSSAEERKAKARERQAAIMEKMRAAQSMFMASVEESSASLESTPSEVDSSKLKEDDLLSTDGHVSEDLAPVVCSLCRDPDSKRPLSFLVFLQKSRLASFVERGPLLWERAHRADKQHVSITTNEESDHYGRNILSYDSEMISSPHLVQLVQSAVNEFTHDALPGEVDAILDFIKARLPAARNIQLPSTSQATSTTPASSIAMLEDEIYESIRRNMRHIMMQPDVLKGYPNISSPDEEGLTKNKNVEPILLGKYIASLSRETSEQPSGSKSHQSGIAPSVSGYALSASFDGFGPAECDGIHISSCGHAMHHECRDRYLISLRERYTRRVVFEGGHVVDPDQEEFLCPVCRRLANSVLPALPGNSGRVGKQMSSSLISEPITRSPTASGSLRLSQALFLLQSAANTVGEGGIQKALSLQRSERMQSTLEPLFRILCRMYFTDKFDKFLSSGRVSHSMILWDTLKYSIISTEIAARGGKCDLPTGVSASGVAALNRELESSSGFVLSLLLRVVQIARSDNCLQVLLRFRGIQLFAGSVCYGASIDEFFAATGRHRGNISSVLKQADNGVVYPDTQFWKRAADPILAHDPFSSLMWVLFSLPGPVLSSAEYFLSLVHLLYAVCVIQALITCCDRYRLDDLILGFGDCFISDICKIKGGSSFVQQYFVSHYIDSTCHLKDMVRRLTCPYLRRCALLWKLLRSSTSEPFCDGRHWDLTCHVKNDMLGATTGLSQALKEVEELENLFEIPSLEVILKNEVLRDASLKWLRHFCEESEVRNSGLALHPTPAVPFRLIQLPHIYHDLLQRYIKQQCPGCKSVQDDRALCLLCGSLCDPRWKPCCREYACKTHAKSCGAGIGVFLLVKRTTILLQRSARQATWASPYLDAFGEEDTDMHRGKPLYLNEERYAALTSLVASHGLDRSSDVLRQTTIESLFLI